jgi:hypothetical protein
MRIRGAAEKIAQGLLLNVLLGNSCDAKNVGAGQWRTEHRKRKLDEDGDDFMDDDNGPSRKKHDNRSAAGHSHDNRNKRKHDADGNTSMDTGPPNKKHDSRPGGVRGGRGGTRGRRYR